MKYIKKFIESQKQSIIDLEEVKLYFVDLTDIGYIIDIREMGESNFNFLITLDIIIKHEKGIFDSLKDGDFSNAGSQLVNQIVGSAPSTPSTLIVLVTVNLLKALATFLNNSSKLVPPKSASSNLSEPTISSNTCLILF